MPGHHQTMLQSLSKTLNINNDVIVVLDALRKQRNSIDYTGDMISDSLVSECISSAEFLLEEVKNYLN